MKYDYASKNKTKTHQTWTQAPETSSKVAHFSQEFGGIDQRHMTEHVCWKKVCSCGRWLRSLSVWTSTFWICWLCNSHQSWFNGDRLMQPAGSLPKEFYPFVCPRNFYSVPKTIQSDHLPLTPTRDFPEKSCLLQNCMNLNCLEIRNLQKNPVNFLLTSLTCGVKSSSSSGRVASEGSWWSQERLLK